MQTPSRSKSSERHTKARSQSRVRCRRPHLLCYCGDVKDPYVSEVSVHVVGVAVRSRSFAVASQVSVTAAVPWAVAVAAVRARWSWIRCRRGAVAAFVAEPWSSVAAAAARGLISVNGNFSLNGFQTVLYLKFAIRWQGRQDG